MVIIMNKPVSEIVKEVIYEYFGMNVVSVTEDMSASVETESFR